MRDEAEEESTDTMIRRFFRHLIESPKSETWLDDDCDGRNRFMITLSLVCYFRLNWYLIPLSFSDDIQNECAGCSIHAKDI